MNRPESYHQATKRSCFLVGMFIRWWATVEAQLDQAMAGALGLSLRQMVIVSVNIPVRAKVHITLTAIEIADLDEKKAKHYKRHLNKLWGLIDKRNIIVHHLFSPTEDETATEFMVIEAKGSLKFPEIIWTLKDFNQSFKKMEALYVELRELTTELKEAGRRAAFRRQLVAALSPIPSSDAPSQLNFQNPPAPRRKPSP